MRLDTQHLTQRQDAISGPILAVTLAMPLLRCSGCLTPLLRQSICADCTRHLELARAQSPFCVWCALPAPQCLNHPKATAHALYWGVGRSYPLLKTWKTSAAKNYPTLSRLGHALLPTQLPPSLLTLLQSPDKPKNTLLLPIPHSSKRLRRLQGSPTLALAEYYSKKTGLRVVHGMKLEEQTHSSKAKLPYHLRKLTKKGLMLTEDGAALACFVERIVLVDDFVTTGATLTEAAGLLQRVNPKLEVLALTLALRPRLDSHDS